jgi:hypothetical protein
MILSQAVKPFGSNIQNVFIQGTNSSVASSNVNVFGSNIILGTNSYGSYIVADNLSHNLPDTHLISKTRSIIQGGSLAVSSTAQFSGRATFSATTAITNNFLTTATVSMTGPKTTINNLTQIINLNTTFS